MQRFVFLLALVVAPVVAASEREALSLYGIEIGNTVTEVVDVLRERYPDMEIVRSSKPNWPGQVMAITRALKRVRSVAELEAAIPSTGVLVMSPTSCFDNRKYARIDRSKVNFEDYRCTNRMTFAVHRGERELHNVEIDLLEHYPDRPSESRVYAVYFRHSLGQRDPFDLKGFLLRQYGDSQNTPRNYARYGESALGRIALTIPAAHNFTSMQPSKSYSLRLRAAESAVKEHQDKLHAAMREFREAYRAQHTQPKVADDPF